MMDALRAAARAEGYTEREIEAILQAAIDQNEPEGPEDNATPTEPPKLYQYHLPYLRVSELRLAIASAIPGGLEPLPDDDLPCGKWLAKHGGALSGQTLPEIPGAPATE